MARRVSVLGVPSSLGAYAPGQEDAPRALRDAGLVARLKDSGIEVVDRGDAEIRKWKPDRDYPYAQNLFGVVLVVDETGRRVAEAVEAGETALVLGGDCTVGMGTVVGVAGLGSVGLVYFDLHADLNTPRSVPDGALDWMGVAHMLGVKDAVPGLRDVGPRTPLLKPQDVVVFAHDVTRMTKWEGQQIDALKLAVISAAEVAADPAAAAAAALEALGKGHDRLVVHFDADVVDFTDAPLSEHTGRNTGVSLATALDALAALLADERVVALTVTEINPRHAEADETALPRLIDGIAAALAGREG